MFWPFRRRTAINRAFIVYMEYGMEGSEYGDNQVRKIFPDDETEEWISIFRDVEDTIAKYVCRIKAGEYSCKDMRRIYPSLFPFMDWWSLERCYNRTVHDWGH